MMQQSRLKRDEIRPETLMAVLFPREIRREKIRGILDKIGLRREIEFVRPDWIQQLIWLTALFSSILLGLFLAWHPIASQIELVSLLFSSPIIAGLLFLIWVPRRFQWNRLGYGYT